MLPSVMLSDMLPHLQRLQSAVDMRYSGKLFYPHDAKLKLDLSNLSPIQGRTAYELYGQFKREMESDQFDARVDAGDAAEPVLLRFVQVGHTSGYAALARARADRRPARGDRRVPEPAG